MGVPIAHHDHGKPDDLLSSFGLDAEGVAERVRRSI
jgi:transketolase C-terminal domain/subunit